MSAAGTAKGFAALLGVAALAAVLVAGSYSVSHDRIVANERRAVLERVTEVVPGIPYDNDPLAERVELAADDRLGGEPAEAFPFRAGGIPAAIALLVTAPSGYSGPIRLLVGIGTDGTVLGVRAVSHRETPGLGDAIDLGRSDWITLFVGRSLTNVPRDRWRLQNAGGAFQQITAATVTSRAVVDAVANALVFYADESARLWEGTADDE